MCCFSGSVSRVADTKIFARLSGSGSQFLVYEMSYEADEPTAMILPLPVELPAIETSVKFLAFDGYRDFFNDLAAAFPQVLGVGIGCGGPNVTVDSKSVLQIHKVGNFDASFVPTIDDFERLDTRFVIPKSTWLKIPEYSDYGFAVFQLESLSARAHPMAFEFSTRWKDRIFFPTVHIHDGEVHLSEKFDHQLFLQHAGFDSIVDAYAGPGERDRSTKFVRSKEHVAKYCKIDASQEVLSPSLLVHRLDMIGNLPNKDQLIRIAGDPLRSSLNLRPLLKLLSCFAPFAIGFGALAWFIRRRIVRSQNRSLR